MLAEAFAEQKKHRQAAERYEAVMQSNDVEEAEAKHAALKAAEQ
jgi:hypothetical protein